MSETRQRRGPASQPTRSAFTLIELLVVVGIISLLVAILMPTMSHVRDMTKKAVCSSKLANHGKAIGIYVGRFNTYPHYAPVPWNSPLLRYEGGGYDDGLNGWAKFYGVLEANDIPGTRKTDWGMWYYGGPPEGIWDGAFCPSMDPAAILNAAYRAGNYGYNGNFMWWVWFHKWAIGYQWSPFLRAGTPFHYLVPGGRDPIKLKVALEGDVYLYQWIMPWIYMNGTGYCAQAVSPSEVANPSMTAEAWDSWDIESTPGIPWATRYCPGYGAFTPGWHGSVANRNLHAMFNGSRHKGPPNILYADGSIQSDATRRVDPAAEGLGNEFRGMSAYTYGHGYDGEQFGNMDRLLPWAGF